MVVANCEKILVHHLLQSNSAGQASQHHFKSQDEQKQHLEEHAGDWLSLVELRSAIRSEHSQM